jgi:hypothetical protein
MPSTLDELKSSRLPLRRAQLLRQLLHALGQHAVAGTDQEGAFAPVLGLQARVVMVKRGLNASFELRQRIDIDYTLDAGEFRDQLGLLVGLGHEPPQYGHLGELFAYNGL